MNHETAGPDFSALSDALNMQSNLHVAEGRALIAAQNEPPLIKEWTVAKEVGKEILKQKWMKHIQEKYPLSDAILLTMWDEFMDKGLLAAQAILSDLKQFSPERIEVNYWDQVDDKTIAGMGTSKEGAHTLHLYPSSLVVFFLRYVGARRERDKVFALKDFEGILAHEFYHMYEHEKFPSVMKKEKEKKYWDRRYEYAARLYSLRWLRRQKPETNAERLGLWFARADVMIGQLINQTHVRDEINSIFGVNKPDLFHQLRMIFTEDAKAA